VVEQDGDIVAAVDVLTHPPQPITIGRGKPRGMNPQ
jgi:hypothetical protein